MTELEIQLMLGVGNACARCYATGRVTMRLEVTGSSDPARRVFYEIVGRTIQCPNCKGAGGWLRRDY